MPCDHFILCHPLLLLPSIFPSIRVFSNELAPRIRWPKDWSFSISPSNEYSGLISFRIDWLDLLAVQGTRQESSPASQFESINSSVLSLVYGRALTSTHDYWKNHSFDYTDLCQQSDVSAFYVIRSCVDWVLICNTTLGGRLYYYAPSCCCCSVAQSCLTLCNPMDCSTPGLSVFHHLPKFAQVHVHCISDVIQPSHPLMPSSSARSLSQHHGLFQ